MKRLRWAAALLTLLAACSDSPELSIAQTGRVSSQLTAPNDDVQELREGVVVTRDLELDLAHDGELVGLRFSNLSIPKDACVTSAAIAFKASRYSFGSARYSITAEDAGYAKPFTDADFNVSKTPTVTSSAVWTTGEWQVGEVYSTGDLSYVVNQVIAHEKWSFGSSIKVIIKGLSGAIKIAQSAESGYGARLSLEFKGGGNCASSYTGNYIPPENTCLEEPATLTLTGVGLKRYRIRDNKKRVIVDARNFRALTNDFLVVFAENPAGVCMTGGLYQTPNDATTPWHVTHNAHSIYVIRSPNSVLEFAALGVDDQIVGDGLALKQGSHNFVWRDSYVGRAGDDLIENDRYSQNVHVQRILSDSSLTGISCRHEGRHLVGENYDFFIEDSVISMSGRSNMLFKVAVASHNYCRLNLRNNVFFLPDENAEYINPNMNPKVTGFEPLNRAYCAGGKNIVVYSGNNAKYLASLRKQAGECFEITQDVNVYLAARNAWFDAHPMFEQWREDVPDLTD